MVTRSEETNPAEQLVAEPEAAIVESLVGLSRTILESLPRVAIGIVVLIASYCVSKIAAAILRKILGRLRWRGSLKDLAGQLLLSVVWSLGVLAAAVVVFPGVTPGKLLTVLGLSSIAIGFAFKDIFENFFAGILILWRFPFENGDFIRVGETMGKVESTSVRMTMIRQPDGQLVVLPNAALFKNAVTVITSQELRRVELVCGVAYGEDVDEARTIIEQAVLGCASVSEERTPEVCASEFNSSSIDFRILWWTKSRPADERRSRDEVVTAVKRGLDEAGIEIPFPYRTLTFKDPVPWSEAL